MQKNINNLCEHSITEEVDLIFPLHKCGLCIRTSLQKVQYRKEREKSNFTVKKYGKHDLSQVIKVNANRGKSR